MSEVKLTDRLEEFSEAYANAKTFEEREKARRKIEKRLAKQERDRDRGKRNAKMRRHLLHNVHIDNVDFSEAERRENSPAWISDKGKGEENMIGRLDGEMPDETYYTRCIRTARQRLRRNARHLVCVFNLIVKNGKDRDESIGELAVKNKIGLNAAKKLYQLHREKILNFFSA